jgi:hypothetical protein
MYQLLYSATFNIIKYFSQLMIFVSLTATTCIIGLQWDVVYLIP